MPDPINRPTTDDLRLIDHIIRNQKRGSLVAWWCEKCERKLYYPTNAPKPQCPHCTDTQSDKKVVVPMKRYYGGLTLITGV